MKLPPKNANAQGRPSPLPPSPLPPSPLPPRPLPLENPSPVSADGASGIGDGLDAGAVAPRTDFDAAAGVAATEPPPAQELEQTPVAAVAQPLAFEAWYRLAHGAFMLGSAVTKLKSLAFNPGDATAQEAFKALYETCAETPSLQFLLRPGGKWMTRVAAVGAFAVPMALGVRAELTARRGGAANDSVGAGPPKAANDNAGPLPAQFVAEMAKAPE